MQYGLTLADMAELFGDFTCNCDRTSKLGDPNTPAHSLPAADVKRLLDAEESGLTIEYWSVFREEWIMDIDFDPIACDDYAYRIKPDENPTLWRDMTDAEKGALLLAEYDGARIETWDSEEKFWEDAGFVPFFEDHEAYRVGSGSVVAAREPIKIQGPSGEILGSGTMLRRDGEWDFDSIEVDG